MALPTTYTAPKDPAELERRKFLAGQVKIFAQNGEKNPEFVADLKDEASKIGISRNQLSNLYTKYKSEMPPVGTPPVGTPPVGTPPVETPMTTPLESNEPKTPLLDRLAALQKAPLGSTSPLRQGARSLESDTGRAFRMARKLQRKGFERAAENIALEAGTTGLKEPALRSQAFGEAKQAQQAEGLGQLQQYQTGMQEEANLRRDLLKQQVEELRKKNSIIQPPKSV